MTSRIRILAAALATAAVVLGTAATAGPAAADPWLTWTVVNDITAGGLAKARPYAGPVRSGRPKALAAPASADAVDSSDDARVVAYRTQTRIAGRDAARHGLTVVVRGKARTVVRSGVSGRPDVSANGRYVTFGRTNGSVARYDVRTRALTRLCRACTGFRTGGDLPGEVANVALSPDRRHVAVWGWTQGDAEALSIYRTSDGRRVAIDRFGEGEPDPTISWTPDSRRVAYAGLAAFDPAAPGSTWTTLLLGTDGSRSATAIRSTPDTRLSGPMLLGGSWWFVRTKGYSPTAKVATLMRTKWFDQQPVVVGTVRTYRGSRTPFVGHWSLTSRRPAALP